MVRSEESTGDGEVVRQVLMGMIVSTPVLESLSRVWSADALPSPYANRIGGWCVKHFNRHNEAPRKSITDYFNRWVGSGNRDTHEVQLVQSLLSDVSDQYERLHEEVKPPHIIEMAVEQFEKTLLRGLVDDMGGDLDRDRLDKAKERLASFALSEPGEAIGRTSNLLGDAAAWDDMFAQKVEPIIRYNGALGEFLGDTLARDNFVVVLAGEKKGKTWALLEMAWHAMMQRNRVFFFEVGDMSERQIRWRFAARMCRHPYKSTKKGKWPCTVKMPRQITSQWKDRGQVISTVECDKLEFRAALTRQQIDEGEQQTMTKGLKSLDSYFRLHCCANSTLSVAAMDAEIKKAKRQGFVPDVVLVDYADILADPPNERERRLAVDKTWRHLRRINLEHHFLLLTATQADTDSYTREWLGRDNFSESKTKNAHPTAVIGLNQRQDEERLGVWRLNWAVPPREGAPGRDKVCVAGCLPLGRPFVVSCYPAGAPKEKDDED